MLASSGFSGFQSTSIARGGVEPAGNSANLYKVYLYNLYRSHQPAIIPRMPFDLLEKSYM